MLKSITVSKLKSIIDDDISIIDIRENEDYIKGHISKSINIPYFDLLDDASKYLDSEKEYYIYCEKGKSSLNLCIKLSQKGYNVINILGGYKEWLKNI